MNFNSLHNKIRRFFNKHKYTCLVALVAFVYSLVLSLRTMPFAEGWYTYYAQCINNGEVVYRDFDYLFPPFYIHLIALFTNIFGYQIIYLRVFGAIIFTLIAIFLFLSVKEIYGKNIAVFATIPAMLYLQSEAVQIFYDYIRVMDVFSCLTLFFLIKFLVYFRIKPIIASKFLFVAGISNAIILLIKQNVGLVFFAFILVLLVATYLVCHQTLKDMLKNVSFFCTGFFLPIIIAVLLMVLNGSLEAFLHQTGSDALAAKGGFCTIVFALFSNNSENFIKALPSTLLWLTLIAIIAVLNLFYTRKAKHSNNLSRFEKNLPTLFCCLTIIGFILMSKYEQLARFIFDCHFVSINIYKVFILVISIFIAYVCIAIRKAVHKEAVSKDCLLPIALAGAYFAISWACGMSAGLAEGQAAFGISFMFAFLLNLLRFRGIGILKYLLVTICFLFNLQYGAKKMIHTYNWWNMSESDYWSCTCESNDIVLLRGIGISKNTLRAYEDIYHLVEKNTTKEDAIYCFPQIPIFYSLCERHDPGVRAKVQWFDVASDTSIKNDMKTIETIPPKVIIIYDTNEFTYSSHERLFRHGEYSATRTMKNFLITFATKNHYHLIKRIHGETGNNFIVYIQSE